jgi:hypothetical protein
MQTKVDRSAGRSRVVYPSRVTNAVAGRGTARAGSGYALCRPLVGYWLSGRGEFAERLRGVGAAGPADRTRWPARTGAGRLRWTSSRRCRIGLGRAAILHFPRHHDRTPPTDAPVILLCGPTPACQRARATLP